MAPLILKPLRYSRRVEAVHLLEHPVHTKGVIKLDTVLGSLQSGFSIFQYCGQKIGPEVGVVSIIRTAINAPIIKADAGKPRMGLLVIHFARLRERCERGQYCTRSSVPRR